MTTNTTSTAARLPHFIAGREQASSTSEWRDIMNPCTQEVVGLVPMGTAREVDQAVAAAKAAFVQWRNTPLPVRMRAMFKLLYLVQQNAELLAQTVAREQGKTLPDAEGEVLRSIEGIEQACSVANLQLGELAENIAGGVDTYSVLQPLGVGVGITPFNFPLMTPCAVFPLAVACGNTFVLKPSEMNPGASLILARLTREAGLPDGVFNVVHGAHDVVNQLCDHPDVKAIHIIGSSRAGQHVNERAARSGKRVNAMMGAKNHMVILEDANKDQTINALLGSAFGAAGQRCMANSVVILVGGAKEWLPDIVARARGLKVGPSSDRSADLSAVVSTTARQRILSLIDSGIEAGAQLLLDGRHVEVPGYPQGNFVGPTIFSEVSTEHDIYKEEIFGPVLCVLSVETLDEAIALVNANPNGNGTSIFTGSGWAARKYQNEIDVGQVGINLPIPVPPTNFSFNGSRGSKRGDLGPNGKQGVLFWTQTKIVMSRWPEPQATSAGLNTTISLKP